MQTGVGQTGSGNPLDVSALPKPPQAAATSGSKLSPITFREVPELGIKGYKEPDITGWNLGPTPEYAQIVTLSQYVNKIRPTLCNMKVVATSGGYDPLQPGHSSCLIESKKHGDIVVAIVNGDWFLEAKKNPKGDVGVQDLRYRSKMVSHIRGVDYVIPFEVVGDSTVSEALRVIAPQVFTKGGDRSGDDNTPEGRVCRTLGIEVIYNVGCDKSDSSSWVMDTYYRRRRELEKARINPQS